MDRRNDEKRQDENHNPITILRGGPETTKPGVEQEGSLGTPKIVEEMFLPDVIGVLTYKFVVIILIELLTRNVPPQEIRDWSRPTLRQWGHLIFKKGINFKTYRTRSPCEAIIYILYRPSILVQVT